MPSPHPTVPGPAPWPDPLAERLADGVGIVSEQRRIRVANAALEQLLAEGDGLSAPGGVLRAADPADNQKLGWAIRQVASGAAARHVAVHRPERVALVIRTFRSADLQQAVVYVRDPLRAPTPDDSVLMEVFGLTGAEARLAQALASGSALTEYAVSRRLSVHTVRAHLKQVLAKTGTHRQPDLVRLLLATSLPLGDAVQSG